MVRCQNFLAFIGATLCSSSWCRSRNLIDTHPSREMLKSSSTKLMMTSSLSKRVPFQSAHDFSVLQSNLFNEGSNIERAILSNLTWWGFQKINNLHLFEFLRTLPICAGISSKFLCKYEKLQFITWARMSKCWNTHLQLQLSGNLSP